MSKKEFAAVALDPEHETYVVHVASLSSTTLAFLDVHPSQRSQISDLISEKVPKKVPTKYSDFVDVFSADLASELSKNTGINDHDDLLAGHFGIDKTRELVGRKYYWLSLRRDAKSYVQGCDICLASKAVCHKPYGDLQSLPITTDWWKDLSMDFVTSLPLSAGWKSNNYDLILVIVDRLTKMVHYEPVKVIIDTPGLAEVIINMVVQHHGLPDSIISNRRTIFTSKFCSSLCYFFGIKRRLSTTFHPHTDGQTKQQNSTMEAYLWVFVNFKQYDWARLLPMAEFAYNNIKNASTGHTPFELNCSYHLRILYEEDVDSRS